MKNSEDIALNTFSDVASSASHTKPNEREEEIVPEFANVNESNDFDIINGTTSPFKSGTRNTVLINDDISTSNANETCQKSKVKRSVSDYEEDIISVSSQRNNKEEFTPRLFVDHNFGSIENILILEAAIRITIIFLWNFNLLFWVAGIAMFGTGMWAITYDNLLFQVLMTVSSSISAIIMLTIIGFAVTIIGFLGCKGKFRLKRKGYCYNYGILVCAVAEIVGSAVLFVYSKEFEELSSIHLKDVIMTSGRNEVEKALFRKFLIIQHEESCCGINSYSDWFHSVWWDQERNRESPYVLPTSCCMEFDFGSVPNCNTGNDPYLSLNNMTNVHKMGCMTSIAALINDVYFVVGAVALSLGLLKFHCFWFITYFTNKLNHLMLLLKGYK